MRALAVYEMQTLFQLLTCALSSSFFCGSETVFDQSKLSCTHAKDSIACGSSTDWHFRNDDFGRQAPREPEERLTEK